MVIGFIGLGLIGGSIAKTIRRVRPADTIVAWNRTQSVLNEARRDGIVNIPASEIGDTFRRCDYIFLCVPVVTMRDIISRLKPFISENTIITDVGSTKCDIHKVVRELGLEKQFIGGHPMAGSEKTGYASSTDRMIENAWYILTPGEDVPIRKISEFSGFISSLGALPLVLSPEDHDYITAAVSHVPHVVSASLVNMVKSLDGPEGYMKQIAAGGFKDITRISSSSPQMWQEICLANGENICAVLDQFIRCLTDFRFAIKNSDKDRLIRLFSESKDYRDSFQNEAPGPIKKAYFIYLDIADETGAIAYIADILANASISIRNIGIIHNRDYEQGVLRVDFYTEDAKNRASGILRNQGYTVYDK